MCFDCYTIYISFAIALAVALFPDLEALFEEIFQLVFLDDASATDFVHVDEEPVYVNVPE